LLSLKFFGQIIKNVFHPYQNINKNLSTKINVFDPNFTLNTSTYVEPFLLVF